eukprot:CAMPEP_0202087138 /NCGR_PEP_ID=MMETSP0964-20121228/35377_1 /ASSEMBLY_ACC=CAM_ASM_000500 /TAXON_ID=4773 /ORGANISM="Schizochytrium aggregatum, Strain ATCC28209" /LENGTH=596 /DNA_ID=CAMNT_0048655077 /DNA_START=10 /DNA_END=1800 /DNA_ORIENTATION=+
MAEAVGPRPKATNGPLVFDTAVASVREALHGHGGINFENAVEAPSPSARVERQISEIRHSYSTPSVKATRFQVLSFMGVEAVVLTLMCAVYGTLAALFAVAAFWYPRTLLPSLDYLRPTFGEPILIRSRNVFEIHDFHYDLVDATFFPVSFALYLDFNRRQSAVFTAWNIVGWASFRVAFAIIGAPAILLPQICTLLGLKTTLPRKAPIVRYGLVLFLTVVIALLFIKLISQYTLHDDTARIMLMLFIFPAFKEGLYLLIRFKATALSFEKDIGGDGTKLRRNNVWIFFMWYQMLCAFMIRLYFTNFKSDSTLTIAIVLQAVQELVLRYSMSARDGRLAGILDRLFGRSEPANHIIIPESMIGQVDRERVIEGSARAIALAENQNKSPSKKNLKPNMKMNRSAATLRATRLANRNATTLRATRRMFHCMVLCGEMVSEYVAIIMTPVLMYLFRRYPLQVPFEWFSGVSNLFDYSSDISISDLVKSALLQLAAEFFVDVTCSTFEAMRGLDIWAVWLGRPKHFLAILLYSAYFASCKLMSMVDQVDVFSNCKPGNLCTCAGGNGLSPHGIRQSYCEVLYPNATPPGYYPSERGNYTV